MPENNKGNVEKDTRKHVNTSCAHKVNGTASANNIKQCALDIDYYDDRIKITFSPQLPLEEQTEKRKYDYNYQNQIVTLLTREKANELATAFENVMKPKLLKGEPETISVPIAGVNQLAITTEQGDNGILRAKLKLIKNIEPNSLIADGGNVYEYEFNTGEYILGYDETNGSFKDRVITYNELNLFIKDLESVVSAFSNAYVHTDRCVNRYWKDTIDDKLNKIGGAQGLDLAYKPRNNGTTGSIFSGHTAQQTSTPTATITNLDELESELPFS